MMKTIRRKHNLRFRLWQPSIPWAMLVLLLTGMYACKKPSTTTMASAPFKFLPPAFQVDFPNDPAKQAQLVDLWNTNLNGFIGNQLSPFFGRATSAQAARRIELGATFSF